MTGSASPAVRIVPDAAALAAAAAEVFVRSAQEAVRERGRFAAALSGGSTPVGAYRLLGASLYRESVPWHKVHLFWADERCVPPDHRDSNYRLVRETLLAGLSLPDGNIHRIKGEAGPEAAAEDYERELRLFFGGNSSPVFDCILLGVGADGHTASIFPGVPTDDAGRLVLSVTPAHAQYSRVTLSLSVLNSAARILFLASGRAKAAIVHRILEAGNAGDVPAGRVNPEHGEVLWIVDRDAASLLRRPPA